MNCANSRMQRRSRVLAALLALGLLQAGCSGSSVSSMVPDMSNVFASFNPRVTTSNANAENKPPDFECPSVGIRRGASTLRVSDNPAEPSPLNLRYQVGIANTARECHLNGPILTMRVGVQGRVVLGPVGMSGEVEVPIRVAVVREGIEPKTITTKLQRIKVTLPPGDSNVLFTHVEEDVSFPMPPGAEIDSYIVYVGFDPLAPKEPARRQQRQPARRGPST
jgi:hypothetical protein